MYKEIKYDPRNSYRVENTTGYKRYGVTERDWKITIFEGGGKNQDIIETGKVELDWEELPQWLKDRIMLLQLATKKYENMHQTFEEADIPFVGERIADTYWVMAEHLQNGCEEIDGSS